MIYRNKFVVINFDTNSQIAYIKWSESTLFMSDDEYIKIAQNIVKYIKKYKIKKILNDLTNFKTVLSLRFQHWAKKYFFPELNKPIKKIAIILPTDYTVVLSIKQLLEIIKINSIEIKLFDNEINATKWLNK